MMYCEDKINFVNANQISNRSEEVKIIDDIMRSKFFKYMEDNEFSYNVLRRMFDNKKIITNEQMIFNSVLRKATTEISIKMIDAVIFLDEVFTHTNKILAYLDSDTLYILKKELSEKYNIKTFKSALLNFIDCE